MLHDKKPKVVQFNEELIAGRMEIITDPVEIKKLENKERKEVGHRTHLSEGRGSEDILKYTDTAYHINH